MNSFDVFHSRGAGRAPADRTRGHAAALLRGIAAAAGLDSTDREKPILVVEELRSHDWASATFVGFTHSFNLRLVGPATAVAAAVDALALRLPDWEFHLPGHIVADIAVAPAEQERIDEPAIVAIPGPSTVSHPLVVNTLIIID